MRTDISLDLKAVITRFVYNMWNGLLEPSLLKKHDYRRLLIDEPSAAEQTIATFLNVITLDDEGTVSNARQAEYRAAQYLLSYIEPSHLVEPPFEQAELEKATYRGKSSGPMP